MLKFKPFKVSFYLILSLALRVNSHSLQERNVPGNDHHVKKINIYNVFPRTVRKASNAISDKNKT